MRFLAHKYLLIVFLGLLVTVRLVIDLSGAAAMYWHEDYMELQTEQTAFYAQVYPHHDVNPMPPQWERLHTNYPPYSLVIFTALVPPGISRLDANRWFTAVELLALIFVTVFVARRGGAGAPQLGLTLTLGFFAMTSLHADIVWGNYALLLTMVAIGLFYAVSAQRWWLAAALWMLVMVKPQFGWAFALLFIERNAWKPWLTAVAGLGLMTVGACLWTQVDVLHVFQAGTLHNWSDISQLVERHSLVSLLIAAGLSPTISSLFCAAAGTAFLIWRLTGPLARATPLHRIALVGLVSRFASYHNICDDLLLLFALIWFGRQAWPSTNGSKWLAFIALGISVWAPTAFVASIPAKIALVSLWILLAVYLGSAKETEGDSPAASPQQ